MAGGRLGRFTCGSWNDESGGAFGSVGRGANFWMSTGLFRPPPARVQVGQVKRSGDHLQINGTVTNISSAALTIPPGAFSFRDSRGISYATTTSGGTTLQPNQSTSFDLGVPVSSDRGLTLVLMLPPDPPLEQILVIEAVP